jgi:hypothetical protein
VVLDSSVGGSLTVSGGTTTIAQLKSGGAYGMAYLATVAGQSVSITNHTVAAVAEPAATGSMYALYVEGVANALVSGGSYSLDTAGGTESGQCVGISRNASNALPINGGVISGVTAFINSPAGLGVFINLDTGGLNPALAIGLTLANNTVTAGAAFAAGGGHMTYIGSATNCVGSNNSATGGGFGLLLKANINCFHILSSATDSANACAIGKGNTGGGFTSCTLFATTVTPATAMMYFDTNPDPGGVDNTGVVVSGNTFTVNGATGVKLVVVDANQGVTFLNGVYVLSGGSLDAHPFNYHGVDMTPATWKATVEPTATFIGFS